MAFYVNEDKPDKLATVHQNQGPCRVPQPKQAKDGRWHGPFDSKDESLQSHDYQSWLQSIWVIQAQTAAGSVGLLLPTRS